MNTPIGRSKRAKLVREITIHEGHPSVCVKYQSYLSAGPHEETATEDQRESAYESMVSQFWTLAASEAQAHGYSGVFSEGRSSGWCTPYTQHDSTGKLLLSYTGQGPDKGYPVFADVSVTRERNQFFKFQRAIRELLADVPNRFVAEISDIFSR